jgi:cell division protein FtsL
MAGYRGGYSRASNTKKGSNKSFFVVLGIGCYALVVLLASIYMDRRTISIGMEWEEKSRQLKVLTQETENLKMERESFLRGDHILERAAALGLRAPNPGQVRLMQPVPATEATDELASQAE